MMRFINRFLTSHEDHLTAFVSGDVLAMFVAFQIDFFGIAIAGGLKVIIGLVVGIAGGFGGLLGKDLYDKFKNKLGI